MILLHSLPPLQIHYEYSDIRNVNRIPIGNILLSLVALNGICPILFSILSSCIWTVPNLEDYFYSTNKIFHCQWIYTNCYWITVYCLAFKISYLLLYAPKYLLLYLLRKPHHCDDAIFSLLLLVLLNQIIPSEYNELRLNTATSSSQHHNEEVRTRNKW